MKKTLLKSLALAAVGTLCVIGSASASQLPPLTGSYAWNSSDYWTVTDLSNGQGTFKLEWENLGASYESSFGLYSLVSSNPTPTVFETFQLFSATAEPIPEPGSPQTASAWFKLVSGVWQISNLEDGIYKNFGNVFGFYADVYTGGSQDPTIDFTWYTDVSLNSDDAEHFAIAYDQPNHDTLIYLEDRVGGLPSGGNDSTDLMATSSDLSPVPEPATMLLFGTGLVGLAGVARRRKIKK